MRFNRHIPRPPEDRAALDAHQALPRSIARERDDVFGAVLDARNRVRHAQADVDEATAARDAEAVLLARAEAALAAWDAAHPVPAPPMDGAQPLPLAKARWEAFLARQTTEERR